MKIVQLITRMDTVGGAQVHVRDIAVSLKNKGHVVHIITGGNEVVENQFYEKDIPLIFCKNLIRQLHVLSDLRAVLEVRQHLKRIRPDLLAAHSSKAGIIGRIAGWTLGIPTVFTAHGWSFTEGIPKRKRLLYMLIEKITGIISDGIITVSEYDRKLALKYKILPIRKMRTIHNGVINHTIQSQTVQDDEIPRMVMVARFSPPKKQLHLLKALGQIQHLKWEMYFAGDGNLLHEAEEFVKFHGLTDRVHFLGNWHDIPELLSKSHVFILLSDWEGLPLSILEAMRGGLPIVASDVGGVKEAVKHSENGFLIPKNDDIELLDKLTLLITDPILRNEMGKRSRRFFENHFNFDVMIEKTFSYYGEVIQRKQKNSKKGKAG